MASVCPGQKLSLTCHTNQNIPQWTIIQPGGSDTYDFRDISTFESISPLPIDVAGRVVTVTVHFSRQSVHSQLPTQVPILG